jgi:hypothetical protein
MQDPALPGGSAARALPQGSYANWATDSDLADAAEIVEAELLGDEEDGEE